MNNYGMLRPLKCHASPQISHVQCNQQSLSLKLRHQDVNPLIIMARLAVTTDKTQYRDIAITPLNVSNHPHHCGRYNLLYWETMNTYLVYSHLYYTLPIHFHDTSSSRAAFAFGNFEWQIYPSPTLVVSFQQIQSDVEYANPVLPYRTNDMAQPYI